MDIKAAVREEQTKIAIDKRFREERKLLAVNTKKIINVECVVTLTRADRHASKTAKVFYIKGMGLSGLPYDRPVKLPSAIFNKLLMQTETSELQESPFIYKVTATKYYGVDGQECDFVSRYAKIEEEKPKSFIDSLADQSPEEIEKLRELLLGKGKSQKETEEKEFYCKFVEEDNEYKVYKKGSDESRSIKNFSNEAEAIAFIESKNID